jgi:JAB domain-containing protein similar to deubiquitination enzymes
MREVCFLIGADHQVLWSDAGQSPVALADSRARWEAIWRLRAELVEIAHSHPVGPLAFSHEDETTMAALLAALGHAPRFSVVAPGGMLARIDGRDVPISDEPPWTSQLRHESGMSEQER